MNVIVAYRSIPQSPGWATGDTVCRVLREAGHTVYPYAKIYQQEKWLPSLDVTHDVKDIDLLLYLECNDSDPIYHALSSVKCIKAYWEFDTALHEVWSREFIKYMKFDFVFMANALFADKYHYHYLPYACDEKHFFPSTRKNSEVCIIGTPFEARIKFCEETGIKLISNIYRDEYAQAIAEAKIIVHTFSSGGKNLITMRPFEVMGSKTFLLAESQNELFGLFKQHRDYVEFRDAKHCKQLLSLMQGDDMFCDYIASNGYKVVLEKHLYRHRVKKILEIINGASSDNCDIV